jgi:hypothetical protein
VLSLYSVLKPPRQNRQVCWSIAVKEKPTVGSQFFGVFPSDNIPNAAKDVKVRFFIHSSNSVKLYQLTYLKYSSEFLELLKLLLILKSSARKKIHQQHSSTSIRVYPPIQIVSSGTTLSLYQGIFCREFTRFQITLPL